MSSAPGLQLKIHGLLLALLCSFTCFQGTDATRHPSINSTLKISPSIGQNFSVPCTGYSAFRSCSIYWLANSSFVEDLYPDGAVSEEEAREMSSGPGRRLGRDLVFHAFSERDLQTTFRCVILDPTGAAQKTLTWLLPEEGGPRSGGGGSGLPEEP